MSETGERLYAHPTLLSMYHRCCLEVKELKTTFHVKQCFSHQNMQNPLFVTWYAPAHTRVQQSLLPPGTLPSGHCQIGLLKADSVLHSPNLLSKRTNWNKLIHGLYMFLENTQLNYPNKVTLFICFQIQWISLKWLWNLLICLILYNIFQLCAEFHIIKEKHRRRQLGFMKKARSEYTPRQEWDHENQWKKRKKEFQLGQEKLKK